MSGFRSRSSKLCNLCPSIHSSVGKESSCNAGDPGLIPGLGRSPGEGIGYPLQYSWASLVAQNKSVNTHVLNFENRVFTQSFYAFGEAP